MIEQKPLAEVAASLGGAVQPKPQLTETTFTLERVACVGDMQLILRPAVRLGVDRAFERPGEVRHTR